MRDHHRRYWAEKRQFHYRDHRSSDRDDKRSDRRQRGYTHDLTPGVIGSPQRNAGRVRVDEGKEGNMGRNAQWRGEKFLVVGILVGAIDGLAEPMQTPCAQRVRNRR